MKYIKYIIFPAIFLISIFFFFENSPLIRMNINKEVYSVKTMDRQTKVIQDLQSITKKSEAFSKTGKLQETGEELYQKNCAVCHGKDRQGNPPNIPSLVGITKKLDQKSILHLLENGRNAMPSFSHLSLEQRQAIVKFLGGENIQIKSVAQTDIQKGESLFKANCALCHKARPDDPKPVGQKNYGRRPPILGGINKALSYNRFEHILNRGPFYMPSFLDMPQNEKKAIYKYLSSLPYSDSRLGRCGGGKCGMGGKCGGRKCR